MKIYNYEENGKFAGISKADPSPLEPDTYLIPALATDKAPPIAKDGFEIYWNGTAWEYREAPKEKPEQPNEYSLWNEALWVWVEDAELKAAYDARIASELRDKAMLLGFKHGTNADGTDRYISVTKDDGDGMMQVEATFKRLRDAITNGELPPETEIKTVIHFKNGTKLPIAEAEFESFSLLFILERGKFFQ